jgi:hypothetical protein
MNSLVEMIIGHNAHKLYICLLLNKNLNKLFVCSEKCIITYLNRLYPKKDTATTASVTTDAPTPTPTNAPVFEEFSVSSVFLWLA